MSLHLLGDEGVLFDAAAQRLYAANTTASYIWCCLEERRPLAETCERVATTFGIGRPDAETFVEAIIGQWRELGLLDRETPEPRYGLLDLHFRIDVSPASLGRSMAPLLAPLALAEPRAGRPVRVDVRAEEGRFVLSADGQAVQWCERSSQVVPMVKSGLLQLALQRSRDFGAIHAAAVSRNGGCVLLPGVAGSGKSTAAAALVSAGFTLLGDDTVVLSGDTLAARPVPFAICLKRGSWTLLADRFPDLAGQPVHDRLDRRRVRYLVPPPKAVAPNPGRWPVRAIVFLDRRDDGPAGLVRLPVFEALRRLLQEFYPLADGLDADKVERLLRWVAAIDCFELRYASVEECIARVGGLCP